MEPPIDFDADAVRNEKAKVLRATARSDDVVRGQYGRGYIEGKEVPGYREEEGIDPESTTETFVAAKLRVDTWRWADTPFYVRTGKRLAQARDDDRGAVQARSAVALRALGRAAAERARDAHPARRGRLARDRREGAGPGHDGSHVDMDFLYGGAFRSGLPEAYERLILDAMRGDPTLFTRADEIEEQWRVVDSIQARWAGQIPDFPNYDAGTWGPDAADELITRDGRSWRRH